LLDVLQDQERVHKAIAKDLYTLGKVLQERQYRYLSYAYRTFLVTLVLGVIVAVASLLGILS
jgi:hypothetical protein